MVSKQGWSSLVLSCSMLVATGAGAQAVAPDNSSPAPGVPAVEDALANDSMSTTATPNASGTRAPGLPPLDEALSNDRMVRETGKGAGQSPGAAGKAETPWSTTLKDGLVFKSGDGQSKLKLGAGAQFDGRAYFGDEVDTPYSFDIRRARLSIGADLGKLLSIQIQAAFEDSPYLRNAYAEVNVFEGLRIRVGQMKVPFSSQWLTSDNHVDFLEGSSDAPLHPYIDRGVVIWGDLFGKALTYNVGIFNGNGTEADAPKGDQDNFKEGAWRLFVQPFVGLESAWIKRLVLVGQGTYEPMSSPTRRFEQRGLAAATYESQIWRWRTEQVLATDGRATDQIRARVDRKVRWGAELHYQVDGFALSGEWIRLSYQGIDIRHELWSSSSKRVRTDPVVSRDGNIDNLALQASWFVTGESKSLDNSGWRQPEPKSPVDAGGCGAWEILGRFAITQTEKQLFDAEKVKGYAAADFTGTPPKTVGEGASVTAAVLEGADKVYEATVGINWTLTGNARLQLNGTSIWVPDFVADENGLVSAGNSETAYPLKKNRLVERENLVGARLIFRL